MALITYQDKVAVNINPDVPDINKVNASDMNEIKNSVNSLEKNIMTAVLSNDIECSTSSNTQNISLVGYNYTGDKLTIDSDGSITGVKIGDGVNQVKVSAQVGISNTHTATQIYNLYIKKGSLNLTYSRKRIDASQIETISTPSFLVDVEEGDVLYLGIYKGFLQAHSTIQSSNNRTFLTVEVVN